MRHIEHDHQCALINWAHRTRMPAHAHIKSGSCVADYLLAIPNGGRRNIKEAVRLRAEGVKAGVSDLFLALPMRGLAGLWLELKAPGGRLTDKQKDWLELMSRAGYAAHWTDDWTRAKQIITDYLE